MSRKNDFFLLNKPTCVIRATEHICRWQGGMYMHNRGEKGFTLVEILVVIAIMGILFTVLLPFVNNAFVKANEVGVKTNFHDFQLASEMLLRDLNGKNLDKDQLNLYLDAEHKLKYMDANIITSSLDSWGNPYQVEFNDRKITFYSNGQTEKYNEKAYVLVSYYYEGVVSSCTMGFMSNNLNLPTFKNGAIIQCGENLPGTEYGGVVPEADTLDAPMNLVATNITNSSARLTWGLVNGATHYILKRNNVTIYIGSGNSFTDIGLNAGVDYTYEVAARNTRTISNYNSVTIKTLTPPGAPANLKADDIGEISVTLSWGAGQHATSYILYRNGTVVYSGSNLMYQDTDLIPYKDYNYSLIAVNSVGVSPSINEWVKTLAGYETIKLPKQGTGSCSGPYNPYIIMTLGELQGIELDINACYELGANIDASASVNWNDGKGFNPIGDDLTYFSATLDGKGYIIRNLHINRPNENNVGLFAEVKDDAMIKSITFQNAIVKGENNVGVVAAIINNRISIENTNVSGTVSGREGVGGLVGVAILSKVKESGSSVTVNGENTVGGLVGENNQSTMELSYATGNVTGIGESVGGLVGSVLSAGVKKSYAAGNVSGGVNVGGLVGKVYSSSVETSYATGSVKATGDSTGGLVGSLSVGSVKNTYATGSVESSGDLTGGLVGLLEDGQANTSYAVGKVTGNGAWIGGLVGRRLSASANYSYYDKETSTKNDTGKGIPLTTEQMKIKTNYASWDFSTIWEIDASKNNGYPYLR